MPEDNFPSQPQTPMPLAAFAATLRPQLVSTSTVRAHRPGAQPTVIRTYSQGHSDEIWIKLLEMRHGIERHTADGWMALIDKYRDEPAHPADPRYGVGA